MSINITVHSSQAPPSSGGNPFASLESVRKAENDKLRKARLVQVRQQSKQLAAKVCRKFKTAKQQELANVERVKEVELKNWKQKHIAKLQADYQHCLEDVGEAHKAAEAAEQCEIWFQEKKATQQAAALHRGRQAEFKLAKDIQDREERKHKKRKDYIPTKSVAIQVSVPAEQKKDVPVQVDDSSSYANTISAFEQFKKGSKAHSVPDLRTQDRPLSPGFLSSDEELVIGMDKNKENIPSHNSASDKRVDTLYYNPTSFTSPETIQHQQQTTAIRQQPLKPFTQVSEFVKRRRDEKSHKYAHPHEPATKDIPTYSSQKIVQFDDLSENTLSFPTSTALDRSILESPRKPVRKLVEQPKAIPAKPQQSSSKQSTTATVASTGSHSGEATSKVQYYDFNTKYRKEYDQPSSFVQRNDQPKDGELNAMQEASRLERLQSEMLNARRQLPTGPDRSEIALEKLQIRKDYENLQLELDKLVRAESHVNVAKKPLMTETRQRLQSEARQKRMNQAVEDLLKQRVLITCPIVREPPKGVQLKNRPSQVNVAAGIGNAAHLPGDDSDLREAANSSDSCSTIMLGYVPGGHSRAGIPLPEADKVAKLKELLQQVNEQKRLLTEELEKEQDIEQELKIPVVNLKSTRTQTDNGIKKLQQRQQELDEQQKQLREKEKEIRDLEKQLKEKFNQLAKDKSKPKVPIHIQTKGTANADVRKIHDNSSIGSNDSIQSGSEIPVKIIITVNDKSKKKVRKTPKKILPEDRKRKKAKDVVDLPVKPAEITPKSPTKKQEVREKPIEEQKIHPEPPKPVQEAMDASPISSTTSTLYRQLPPKIDNRIGELLKQLAQPQVPPPKPTKSQRPDPAPKHQLKKITPPAHPPPITQPQRGQNFNPNLMQYIVRLLGMSRQSIDQLGVSSSTSVSTPHDSVVNVSANQSTSTDEHTGRDQLRMDKLRRFIGENYNFLSEIDETLKEQELSGTVDENNISRVEDVWMKTLSRKEKEIRREKPRAPLPPPPEQSPPVKESSLKSILKSPKKAPAKVATIMTPQGNVQVIDLSSRAEQEVLEKYSHLADNCSKRISELSEMIQKVREEKKKLIENSLSSSEPPESSTKYLDLPRSQQKGPAAETSPQSAKEDPVSEEINNIFTNARQIGLSKDSGIAMSRPVTSSDYRDSPDARPPNAGAPQFESSEDLSSREVAPTVSVAFEPLLKDIPKISPRLSTAQPNAQPIPPVAINDPKDIPLAKRTKPPVAITRYSPQLEEPIAAHELSTIPEVETPLASKMNISIAPSERLDPAEQILVEVRDKLLEHARALGYEGFPNYRDYVLEQNLEGTRYDPEKTSYTRLNELLEVTGKSDLRYQNFPAPAPEMNITEESATGNGKKPELESNSSSSTTLPDVVAELKLRNIIDKSFDNSLDDSNLSTPDSGSLEVLHPLPQKSPIKLHQQQNDHPKTADHSVSETTASLERDLNQVGLRWASSMLKKNQQALLQDHSSSSSLSPAEDIRRLSAAARKSKPLPSLRDDPDDSQTNAVTGKPLNLKEFIARELMIRTNSDLNSLSDSSSPCSMLLRSLLDISHINSSTPELLTQTTDKNVQRTSTPVASKSSSGTPREAGGATKDGSLSVTGALFSGESRISSVHMSSSSGGENKLSVPNVRLDVDRYTRGRNGEKK